MLKPASKTEILLAGGGATKLGKAMGITQQAVSQWVRVPATRVLDVERLTGISRTLLRPDLYPDEGGKRKGAA